MASVNRVTILGNLGAKPELKDAGSSKVCNMTVATNETYKDKNEQKVERVEWHRVTAWGKTAENCAKYLDKGRTVYVEGRLQTRKYEKDGVTHYATDIVATTVQFIGGGKGDGAKSESSSSAPDDFGTPPADNSDIPF